MKCPKCSHDGSFVRETRAQGTFIKRVRVCTYTGCGHTFRTFEVIENAVKIGDDEPMLMSKSEGRRLFDALARVLGVNVTPVR